LSEGGHTKESRSYLITDYAFFAFKAVAVKEGFGGNIGAFMDQLARKLAEEELSERDRQQVEHNAEIETGKRRNRRIEKAGLAEAAAQEGNTQ